MVGTSQAKPRIGDKAFEVEWCSACPADEFGSALVDEATYETSLFRTKDAALRYAKSVYAKDFFGSVRIIEVQFVPYAEEDAHMVHVGFWDAVSDSEFYEGESNDA